MSSLLSLAPHILIALFVGGLCFLAVGYVAKVRHYTPSEVALGRLMAVGVPLMLIVNLILFTYSPGRLFTYVGLGIEVLVLFLVTYRFVLRMKKERQMSRDPHKTRSS